MTLKQFGPARLHTIFCSGGAHIDSASTSSSLGANGTQISNCQICGNRRNRLRADKTHRSPSRIHWARFMQSSFGALPSHRSEIRVLYSHGQKKISSPVQRRRYMRRRDTLGHKRCRGLIWLSLVRCCRPVLPLLRTLTRRSAMDATTRGGIVMPYYIVGVPQMDHATTT